MKQRMIVATLASAVIGSLTLAPAIADEPDTNSSRATGAQVGAGAQGDRSMGEVVDDATIVARVKSSLLSSSEVEGLDVNVDARNGIVTLSGSADTMAEKSSAERIAKSADGVKSVNNRIEIKSASSGADADRSMAPRTAPAPAATPADATPPAN